MERAIGEVGHKIQSKQVPFANMATILLERVTTKLLTLKSLILSIAGKEKGQRVPLSGTPHKEGRERGRHRVL